ncbi:DUF2806 domain-containing protein [Vibrio metschnikovii]|uniref:DUF2806 domain-containing protein n=2 Tax=Unclassified Bacteria TaxID=49928 RepID=A0AAU6UWH9_UNCXX|nr:DUF2806 domain-containing protein [Vibrio metschnikovii]EKO3667503.1 DUF2806 domain-containing protein [Vibrio metschnikovii]EKO3698598.1 DUF2806 domain-containing protein [Vibrio metschnikovii]EKO3726301.1 DUF2806 domain-containing protein [Vibrio metschnikovii]EKO3877950.1 DUF2806 domain-containing protein [Vibrio metschnikovii]
MSDDNSTSLVNLGEISKPANTLIEKVSSAIGGVFEPWQIKRIAKAEAEANLIKAESEIQITDMHRRAMHRFVEEEAKRQENMEEITKKSISLLEEQSDPSKMEDDWVTNFFDKSRIVSDDDMQVLWANVLAGEANKPGSFSRRTVNLLSDLDKRDAELFQTLCRFGWSVGYFTPLIFDSQASIYNNLGINFNSLSHLDSLGLIQFNSFAGFSRTGVPKSFAVTYCGQTLQLVIKEGQENTLSIGQILLTQAGQELAQIVKVPGVQGLYDYVKDQWKSHAPS